jgi:hypothetical protein
MVTEKKSDDTELEKKISRFCRINLKTEALLYTLLSLIIYIPIFGLIKLAKGIIWVFRGIWWVVSHIPQVAEWIMERVIFPILIKTYAAIIWCLLTILGIIASIPAGLLWIYRNILIPLAKGVWRAILYASHIIAVIAGIVWKILLYFPPVIEWITEKLLLPVFRAVWGLLRYIGITITFVAIGLIKVVNWVLGILIYLYSRTNKCAARSLIRLFTVIGMLVSCGSIINGLLHYPLDIIFTGYYYDSNPDIQFIHMMIAVLMISITAYYHAWAYSPSDELKFVCKNTWQCTSVRLGLRNLWNK